MKISIKALTKTLRLFLAVQLSIKISIQGRTNKIKSMIRAE